MQFIMLLAVGALTGVLSGIFGIGGGVILVPALVVLLGFPQHSANGTSLVALLAPVGLLGAFEYYKAGKIELLHIKAGLLISLGIFFGTYIGARVAVGLPVNLLRRLFAGFLAAVALKLWFLRP